MSDLSQVYDTAEFVDLGGGGVMLDGETEVDARLRSAEVERLLSFRAACVKDKKDQKVRASARRTWSRRWAFPHPCFWRVSSWHLCAFRLLRSMCASLRARCVRRC